MTTLQQVKDRLPDWARDEKLNLAALSAAGELSPRQAWGSRAGAPTGG